MAVFAYCEGWESGTTRHWDNVAATGISAAALAARNGGFGLRYNPSGTTGTIDWQFDTTPVQSWCARFYFQFPSLPTADVGFSQFRSGNDFYQFAFQNSNDKLVVHAVVAGVLTETEEGPVLTAGTWYRVDCLCFGSSHGAGADEQMQWSVAEAGQPPVAYGTLGPNTSYVTPLIWRMGSASAATFDVYVDDIMIIWTNDGADSAVVEAAYPLRDGYVKRLTTTGVGTHANSTSFGTSSGTIADSYQLLDDLATTTATGYIEQTTIGGSDYLEYTLTNLASDGTEETARVATGKWGRRSSNLNANNAGIHIVEGSGGTDHELYDSSWIDNASPWTPDDVTVAVSGANQYTSTGWTRSRIDAFLMRWGYSGDIDGIPRLPAFTMEVEIPQSFNVHRLLMLGVGT